MLNKNANCYNIEYNFKYITIISTFSEHITIFRIFSIGIWELNYEQRQTNKAKNGNLFRIFKIFIPILQKLLLLTATARRFFQRLVRPFPTLSCFELSSTNFFVTNFPQQKKIIFSKQLFPLPAVEIILHILCVWTLKILYRNKPILTS